MERKPINGKSVFLAILAIALLVLIFSPDDEQSEDEGNFSSNNFSNFYSINLPDNLSKTDDNSSKIEVIKDPRDNMSFWYWKNNPIPYHFTEGYRCDDERGGRINYALNQITQETRGNISFYEDSDTDNGIEITCLPDLVGTDEIDKNHAVAGEAGIIDYEENEIISSSIVFYKINSKYLYCKPYPTTELHELLHAFGIDHVEGRASIMNAQRGYNQQCTYLDEEIANCLKYIYGGLNKDYTCKGIPFTEMV